MAFARHARRRWTAASNFISFGKQAQTIQNKKSLEERAPPEHAGFKRRMRETAADARLAYDYRLKLSMIASLRRAAELG